ncbi:MAG: 6-hydroxymethylpterin diphosphokinase MptE-like protein [Phycisphaerales bacterium JB059]
MDILSFGLDQAYQGPGGESDTLSKNLAALAKSCPALCERIRATAPRTDIEFIETEEGPLSARLRGEGDRLLASARRPASEARRLADQVKVEEHAGVAVLGFGLGLHVERIAERLGKTGVILCFEPDVALLRAVLERVDHSAWIERTNLAILTSAEDGASISGALSGIEGLVAMGFEIVVHPPSRARLGEDAETFCQSLSRVLAAVRTSVVTTLVQGEATLRNVLMNADHYVSNEGIAPLRGAYRGRAAIVVSAGPSLERAIDALAEPGVRERCVIIAVQTVLKPLLARGVRPHFVTALDHHEISRRFYEGLTPEDVEGVTLIAEPKANPSIPDAFPGRVLTPRDELLDEALGADLFQDMGAIEAGATVAHLAHYFARFLGCDPVILVGQDLAFTDGQYYSAGAAIHDVWAPELGEFRTLETLEWERIVRMRSLLRRVPAAGGGEVYTDEQMATYLSQFEAMFAQDAQRGCTTIDTCVGGAFKRGVEPMSIEEALERFAPQGSPVLDVEIPGARDDAEARRERARARFKQIRRDAYAIGRLSAETEALLSEMLEHQQDQARVNRLITQVNARRDRVVLLQPALRLVQFINQTGALTRVRADRALEVGPESSPLERQRRQIERDRTNVSWIREASESLVRLLDASVAAHAGRAAKLTSDPAPRGESEQARSSGEDRRVAAIVPVCEGVGGLGQRRDLSEPVAHGRNALRLCVERLRRASQLDEIVLLAGDPGRVRELLGDLSDAVVIEEVDGGAIEARRRGVGAGRVWGGETWRGGVGGLTASDEAFEPRVCAGVMAKRGLDGAVFVGDDWALVDPGLTDAVIERYRSAPASFKIVFTQAPPGICPVLLDRSSVESLSDAREQAGSLATIGGLVGYLPIAPQGDPIAKPVCVQVPASLRSLCVRAIPDTLERRRLIGGVLGETEAPERLALGAIERALRGGVGAMARTPRRLTLELCTGRLLAGEWGAQLRGGAEAVEREMMNIATIHDLLRQVAGGAEDATLTLHGVGDPLMHPRALEVVRMAREVGFAGVHLRTDLARLGDDEEGLRALLASGVGVISVDLLATSARTYERLTGSSRFDAVERGVKRMVEIRRESGLLEGMERPWIVPRITRCEASLAEIERFHDTWIMACGASVIDPPASTSAGARIGPLPAPGWRAAMIARESMVVRSDGEVVGAGGARFGGEESLEDLWARVRREQRESGSAIEPKPGLLAGRAA